jgi:hypothetical protein
MATRKRRRRTRMRKNLLRRRLLKTKCRPLLTYNDLHDSGFIRYRIYLLQTIKRRLQFLVPSLHAG